VMCAKARRWLALTKKDRLSARNFTGPTMRTSFRMILPPALSIFVQPVG
jgi:hypothetical protein